MFIFKLFPTFAKEPNSPIEQYAIDRIKSGIPRQQVCHEVMNNLAPKGSSKKSTSYLSECLRVDNLIMKEMIDRNERASQLEKALKIEEAIPLFEESLKDLFLGAFPYNRLRIIYTRLKQFDDAIRVCNVYVTNPYIKGEGGARGKAEFREYIVKLQKKK